MTTPRMVRMLVGKGPFIRMERGCVIREDSDGLWIKAKNLRDPLRWSEDVVHGPYREDEVTEYVPEPPEPTLKESIRNIWPPKK